MNKEALVDWAFHYIRSKDALMKDIVNIAKNQDGFDLVVERKEKKQYVAIIPALQDLSRFLQVVKAPPDQTTLVVLNKRGNLNIVKKFWNELSKHRTLNIIFANPNSHTDYRWVVSPWVHNRVTEPRALSKGLDALFDGVEEVN